MITTNSPKPRVTQVLICCVFSALLAGCGGGDKGASPPPPPLENQAEIVALLPSGVTLDTPIVPDKLFGENAKTVGDALASLHAHVRDKKLVDGGMGQPIHIQKPGEKAPKKSKGLGSAMTITIAQ